MALIGELEAANLRCYVREDLFLYLANVSNGRDTSTDQQSSETAARGPRIPQLGGRSLHDQ